MRVNYVCCGACGRDASPPGGHIARSAAGSEARGCGCRGGCCVGTTANSHRGSRPQVVAGLNQGTCQSPADVVVGVPGNVHSMVIRSLWWAVTRCLCHQADLEAGTDVAAATQQLKTTRQALEKVTDEKRRLARALEDATHAHQDQVRRRLLAEDQRAVMERQRDELVGVMRQLQDSASEQEQLLRELQETNRQLAAELAVVRQAPTMPALALRLLTTPVLRMSGAR